MRKRTTGRGFRIYEFTDGNGTPCQLQASSSARPMVWLGAADIGLKKFTPGSGWEDVPLAQTAEGVSHIANNRMHLTQAQVRKMLPALIAFAETGELP